MIASVPPASGANRRLALKTRRRMPLAPSIATSILAAALACALITNGDARTPPDVSRSEALAAHERNALWKVVNDMCVPDMRLRGSPAPCAKVDLGRGFVVLKDIVGHAQVLLMPTRRITGIEDPQLLSPTGPNYWQAAWEARATLEQRLGRPVPREAIGLAINSAHARTQDLLHIHVDCLRPDVAAVLRVRGDRIGARWSDLRIPLVGRRYRAMRIMGEDLGSRDPFKLLATGDPHARADMGQQTLVVAGYRSARGKPGFLLLSRRADPAVPLDRAHGENLLDHRCAGLSPPTS
jgi:CDP-diacylglycerol pyrophosphatase